MKKIVSIILMMTAFFMFGSTNVNAESKPYWEEYFEKKWSDGLPSSTRCAPQAPGGVVDWKDMNRTFKLIFGGCGSYEPLKFSPYYYTNNVIFTDVENVTVKSSDETIMTAEVKPYDFSNEKAAFNKFVEDYNKLTFDEFKEEIGLDTDSGYTKKPTWWEYNGYESEPTWWVVYGFEAEPTNAVEVITHAKDLGKATLTVSAKDKEDIYINWAMEIVDDIEPAGVVQILNNLDRYKDVMTGGTYWISGNSEDYTFLVSYDKNTDLSELINTLKGKDVKLLFRDYSGIGEASYILNGKDVINTVGEGFTYSHNISMETSINKDKIDSLVELKDAIYIDFTYHGVLPTNYKLNVNVEDYIVGSFVEQLGCEQYSWETDEEAYMTCWSNVWDKAHEYYENTTFDLLYYNPETEKMEVVKQGLKIEEGFITLEFDHFSSYVLVASSNYKIINKALNNVQTSSMNVGLYIGVALVSLIGIGYILIKKNKKKIA